jgi:septum formation protein
MSIAPAEPIILASASEVRARLLRDAGVPVTVERAGLDEDEIKRAFRGENRPVEDCATALAEAKATRVSQRRPGRLVIGADQMLVCDGCWFDKPDDRDEARAQLAALRGRSHDLVSAVTVVRNGAVLWHAVDRARLAMRSFSDAFLDAYLDAIGDAALATVGSYLLEGPGVQLFAKIDGDYFSILGLPLLPLLDFLRGHGALRS